MPSTTLVLSCLTVGFAVLNVSSRGTGPSVDESTGVAWYLFGVIGVLLITFWAVVTITTVSRAIRRRSAERAGANAPTDVSVDPWTEAGKRFGRKPPRRRK
jgi:hypothetical protein